ncbi:MAG: hypothetical protein ACM3OC_02150 [Deltaproteobacteria bacterium]
MKAIALLSGGLDSTLAARIMDDMGIGLIAFNTISPFCLCNHRSSTGCFHGASAAAKLLGIKFVNMDVGKEFIEIVRNPEHGYGSNMNPCLDCRILLFRKAKEMMEKEGASFIITGEVVGQRPMSQRRAAMKLIDREAGLEGLVLRPLCAKVMEETIPEKQGWVSREKMLSISGRGRKEQFTLAQDLGIKDYPCPSGGCLLTDPGYARKVKDLLDHGELTLENCRLLRLGRHFRLGPGFKLIVGRDQAENERLPEYAKEGDLFFEPSETAAGAFALGRGAADEKILETCFSILARYCDGPEGQPRAISLRGSGLEPVSREAMPLSEGELSRCRL